MILIRNSLFNFEFEKRLLTLFINHDHEKPILYDPAVYQECLTRIESINEGNTPEWGEMSAAQMFSHCSAILDVANGKELKGTPFIAKLLKGYIKKMVYNEKPYPKNSKTHPQYQMQGTTPEFEAEKQRLTSTITKFHTTDPEVAAKIKHPLFGYAPRDKKGWGMFKHLDHHLTQFGV